MLIPIRYNLRYLVVRWQRTLTIGLTFGLVVATFVIVMSLSRGIERALQSTGDRLNVVVMRKGAQSEGQSELTREQYHLLCAAPGIARDAEDRPIAAAEIIALINRPRMNGKSANVQVRGVSANSFGLRPQVQVVAGRKFRPGMREAMVSKSIAGRFQGFGLGDTPRMGRGSFTIVGIFDAAGTAYDSEVWADAEEVKQEFDRDNYSCATVRARDGAGVTALAEYVDGDKRLKMQAKDEAQYYAEQTMTAAPVKAFAFFLAITMAIGASFAAMNTMYANVSNRVREIGTLRIVGFSPRAILMSFMIESVLLALVGGVIGCLLALPMNGLATGTTNFGSFSEIVFFFTITPELMVKGVVFAVVMGVIGGFPPAWSAARQPLLSALRQA